MRKLLIICLLISACNTFPVNYKICWSGEFADCIVKAKFKTIDDCKQMTQLWERCCTYTKEPVVCRTCSSKAYGICIQN